MGWKSRLTSYLKSGTESDGGIDKSSGHEFSSVCPVPLVVKLNRAYPLIVEDDVVDIVEKFSSEVEGLKCLSFSGFEKVIAEFQDVFDVIISPWVYFNCYMYQFSGLIPTEYLIHYLLTHVTMSHLKCKLFESVENNKIGDQQLAVFLGGELNISNLDDSKVPYFVEMAVRFFCFHHSDWTKLPTLPMKIPLKLTIDAKACCEGPVWREFVGSKLSKFEDEDDEDDSVGFAFTERAGSLDERFVCWLVGWRIARWLSPFTLEEVYTKFVLLLNFNPASYNYSLISTHAMKYFKFSNNELEEVLATSTESRLLPDNMDIFDVSPLAVEAFNRKFVGALKGIDFKRFSLFCIALYSAHTSAAREFFFKLLDDGDEGKIRKLTVYKYCKVMCDEDEFKTESLMKEVYDILQLPLYSDITHRHIRNQSTGFNIVAALLMIRGALQQYERKEEFYKIVRC